MCCTVLVGVFVPPVLALHRVRSLPGNDQCAECDAKDPDWISLNLGIVMCMECSGVHRAMGVHISKVNTAAQ